MRILTVRQPWAWAIIHGGKDVENRVSNLAGDYRGPVLIHVAKAYAKGWESDALAQLMNQHEGVHEEPQPWHDHFGEIIGVVDLVDVHRSGMECAHGVACHEYDLCSPWAEAYTHHLSLANPRALDEPIPYKGALGLRKTRFAIFGDWLAQWTDTCTCGTGVGLAATYGHEPGCGLEQLARLEATS